MSSFNVAQILPSLDSGGVERGTIEVANYLSELNLKNNIISNGGRLIKEIDKNYTDKQAKSVKLSELSFYKEAWNLFDKKNL